MKVAKTVAALVVAAGMATTASAANISINTINGTTKDVSGFDHQVDGDDMDGMLVTATVIRSLGGGQFQTVTLTQAWDADFDGAGDHGGVTFGNPDFDLEVEGDTFDNGVWDLDFDLSGGTWRLLSLAFDGLSGNTVFDRTWNGNVGTAGSSTGKDFGAFTDWNGNNNITGTYSNRVSLNGAAPVGDVWANFLLLFGDGSYAKALPEGGDGDNKYKFNLDTDNVRLSTTPPAAVPEPGSMLLLGSGLVGLATRLRRKKS